MVSAETPLGCNEAFGFLFEASGVRSEHKAVDYQPARIEGALKAYGSCCRPWGKGRMFDRKSGGCFVRDRPDRWIAGSTSV